MEGIFKNVSSDTGKENASVVDSSVTESKLDLENCNDLGSSSYKEDEELFPPRAEERVQSPSGLGHGGAMKNDRQPATRYFIIKSLNHHNIQLSIERGIWATQVMNEPILEEAFHNSGRVILIFSVNMSGFFQGYAQMMSPVGWRRDNVWSDAGGRSNLWGRTFNVKWLRLHNLPFQKTLHLKNPLNDYKPVKISRDCQELSQEIGQALCELIDGSISVDGELKRNNLPRNELMKRTCTESSVPLQDEAYCHAYPPLHMAWPRMPVASNFNLAHGRCPGGFLPENSPTNFEALRGKQKKNSRIHGKPSNMYGGRDIFQLDGGGLSAGRGLLADSLSEEDFLDMKMTF
ncbi:PREDICTED: YTH domain-containing protein 2 isoform X2 [Nelumbo nucifera]|uniref:YTH domain-containing family protein n=1 Tax=Nelumbo nucifera TaxID=4432 RepID=A0A1U8Q6E6_NELNU|nr:PREDICTED: YTH domain-containing protein 2 isoform X2 [Nelumbo nucifera]